MGLLSAVTFLFTDIEGSTRLWDDHPGEMAGVLADHDRQVRNAIEGHGGRVFSTAGDGFAAVFPSVGPAVEAAVAVQTGTGHLVAGDQRVRVRMAVHSGEVEERDDGFFGPVLNRCARLRDAAHGGQVLVSSAAQQLLQDRFPEDITLLGLGEHRLRDLSRPEWVFQVCHPDLDSEFPPLRSLAGLSTNLPVQVTSFVGRVQESAELEKLVRGSRLVTVTGAGGCGKSRLAVQVAAELLDEFGDGVWLVELASLSDPEVLVSTVASELGIREQPGVPPIEALTGYLRSKTVLLVVDNCEHLIEPVAEMVAHLLSHTEGVRVLATSREPLHIRGETVYQLPTLPVPEPDDDWDTLNRIDSVRLFAERADAAHPGFRVTHTNAPAVASICTHLDGIPLAVELAAAATRLMSPDQIDQRLGDRFRVLTGGARDDLDHHRTLQAAIDWSHQLLTPEQQAVFARLAVFAGDFTIEAAEQVCADETIETGDIWETIVQLADRSLLEIEETDAGVRYGMLETIRTYANDRLDALPDQVRDQLNEHHFRYFLSLAEEAQPGPMSSDPPPPWLADLDAATADLRQALSWAIENSHDQYAVDLAGALGWYWQLRKLQPEGLRWYQAVRLYSERVTVRSRVRALGCAAHFLGGFGTGDSIDPARARQMAEESLQMARQEGDPGLVAEALREVVFVFRDSGSISQIEEGLGLATEINDEWLRARFRLGLGHHHRDCGETAIAKTLFEEDVLTYRRLGDDRSLGGILGFLAVMARDEGDLDQAGQLLQPSLDIGRKLNDPGIVANALALLGEVAYLKGDLVAARSYLEEVVELRLRLRGGRDEPDPLLELGFVAYRAGDLPTAKEYLCRTLRILFDLDELNLWEQNLLRRGFWAAALLLATERKVAEAAVLLAAAESTAHITAARTPWRNHPYEQAEHHDLTTLIETALTPEALHQARQQGGAMTLDQATDYALNLLDTTAAE